MSKNKFYLLTGLFGLLITTLTVSSLVSASDGSGRFLGKKFDSEQHQAVKQAIENNDYDAWSDLMGDKKMGEAITKENFSQLATMHELMQSGQFEEAEALREELGLPGMHKRGFKMDPAQHEAMQTAISNNDYDAWLELAGDKNITEYVNSDNFDQFVAMHNLMNNDQFEEAKIIAEELGLPEHGQRHRNHNCKF